MESEPSGIFLIELVAKCIVLESQETQRRHVFAVWDLFLNNIQITWTKLLHLSVFFVKQYRSLIYVEEKSLCLFNWVFPFADPREPISCSNVAKIFHTSER